MRIDFENETTRLESITIANNENGIDTAQLAGRIAELLNKNGIPRYFITRHICKISVAYFDELLQKPKAWADMHESQRMLFRRIEKWTKRSRIKSMKRPFVAVRAKVVTKHREFRLKKKQPK